MNDRRYLDTSALVKLYVPEPNTPQVQAEVTVASELLISDLTLLEFRSAIYGMVRKGRLSNADAAATFATLNGTLASYTILPLSSRMAIYAEALMDTHAVTEGLRPLDALHLAVAQIESQSAPVDVFVSTDTVQRQVAQLCGFTVKP